MPVPADRPGMVRTHIAWIDRGYADAILAGTKTIESRLSVRGPAFERVHKGDRIYFRVPGSGFVACARVSRGVHLAALTPEGVDAIREAWGGGIGAEDGYWRERAGCRYATLAWLTEVRAVRTGPAFPRAFARSAWVVQGAGQGSAGAGPPGVNARVRSPVAHS